MREFECVLQQVSYRGAEQVPINVYREEWGHRADFEYALSGQRLERGDTADNGRPPTRIKLQ